ncbi:MAG TPA: MFS transporter [Candidatus Acidoferrales bacterium]|nr:MFS transporter [Candidatus Acidoferrales bacterium]
MERIKPVREQVSKGQAGAASGETGTRASAIAMYGVLLLAYSVNAADRQLFPLLAHDVRVQYGFSLSDTGLLTTIFTLGLAVAGLPTGYLLARFSRKTVLLLGIGIFSTGTALTVLALGFPDMLVYLAATGIGEAMQLTVMIAIAANYFVGYRAAAIGSMNVFFGLGAFSGPILGGLLLTWYRSWRAPMIAFGILGFIMIAVISVAVRPWFSQTHRAADARTDLLGAPTLLNRNTIILTALSVIGGLVLFGFTGMYPTYLREALHYTPKAAGIVASFYGFGALLSIFGGWLGDLFSPRAVLSAAFFSIAALGYLCFHGSEAIVPRALLTCAYGAIGSGTIYVNLAAYHVKAVRSRLSSRASGMFVTSLYAAAAAAGYLMGGIASHAGWALAGEIQITLLSLVAGSLALTLQPDRMSL